MFEVRRGAGPQAIVRNKAKSAGDPEIADCGLKDGRAVPAGLGEAKPIDRVGAA